MNAPDNFFLPDVQSAADTRRLAIQQVGVKGLRYPMQFETSRGEVMNTIAHLTMTVGLPPEVKGTHMSRFVELLEGRSGSLTQGGAFRMLQEMLLRLDARSGRIEMSFPYFIRKTAPVSGVESLLDYDATLIIEQAEGQAASLTLRVVAAVTSLCPCSKKISDYGAHNQRSHITLETRLRYDNPKFVEDLVRDIALRLMNEPRFAEWKVASENFESIHNHSAYAELFGVNA